MVLTRNVYLNKNVYKDTYANAKAYFFIHVESFWLVESVLVLVYFIFHIHFHDIDY